MSKQMPTTIRTTTVADYMDTIQTTISLLGGEKKIGAEIALNALRKKLGIPLDGEQIELFADKKPRTRK